MKKIIIVFMVVLGGYGYIQNNSDIIPSLNEKGENNNQDLSYAYDNQLSGIQVRGSGVVSRILSGDNEGGRHQRFILRLSSGQTLLVAHNIDLAPRIDHLQTGDSVGFFGEYEWNSKGGVIHWTHHDPGGKHVGGWLEHSGRKYK